jgi:FkbM family methyltransferase
MSIKHAAELAALRCGAEANGDNNIESAEARLFWHFKTHRIDTIIDVGANDGGYGNLLRRGGYDGSILSFEPLDQEHARLKSSARGDDRWFVAPRMAHGSENGEVEIHVAGNSASSSILPMNRSHEDGAPESRYVGAQRVPLRRLDEIQHAAIDRSTHLFLKVDTQGFEMSVLAGAEMLMHRLSGVQLEHSLTELYDGQILSVEMIQWLREHGFCLWNVIPGFVDPSTGRPLQFDGIFFRATDRHTDN